MDSDKILMVDAGHLMINIKTIFSKNLICFIALFLEYLSFRN